MKPGKRAPQSPLGALLFMTWLVAIASVATGASLPVATLVAYVLTLLLLQLRSKRNERHAERERSRSNRSGTARGPWTWSESALPKIREVRRRARREQRVRIPLIKPMPVTPIPKPPPLPFEDAEAEPTCSEDDRWSGLLTLLALAAVIFSGTALVRESARLVALDERFSSVFLAVDLLAVCLLPVLIGMLCRSEIHSILTMIALSAALQAILFRMVALVPEGFFLALAALASAGTPLGLVRFWRTIDRRPERGQGSIETTTGKLLRGKWQRMRPGKHTACGS
jgi:hypothetical protein